MGLVTGARGRDMRSRRLVVATVLVLVCVPFVGEPASEGLMHFDQALFLDTLEYQRDGAGYYDAHLQAFADRGVTLSEVRAVRQPLIFMVWRWIPADLLWPVFLLVAIAVCVGLMMLTDVPELALAVMLYLLLASEVPARDGIEQWMLVELWALLPLTLSLVAWRREHHWAAALLAATAFLIRETTAGFLVVGLLLAWSSGAGVARRAWTAGAAVAAGGYVAHSAVAAPQLAEVGNEAVILGTGDGLGTLLEMASWMVPGPDVLGLAVVAVACARVVRSRRDLLPVLGLFALLAAGLFVKRGYWGFLFIPFALLLAGEQLTTSLRGRVSHLRPRQG